MVKRRTKKEMSRMREEVKSWLLKNGNDPHKAWDAYVAHHLKNNLIMDYYVKGLKDFVRVSSELSEQMEKDKIKKEHKEKTKQEKERLTNELKKLPKKEAVALWKENKDKLNNSEKIMLSDIVIMILEEDYNIEQRHVNLLKKIGLSFPR